MSTTKSDWSFYSMGAQNKIKSTTLFSISKLYGLSNITIKDQTESVKLCVCYISQSTLEKLSAPFY